MSKNAILYLENFLLEKENTEPITKEKLVDFKFPKGEYFGYYNPETGEVYYKHKMEYPKKPKGNWYQWHNHPKGISGYPSEIDLVDMIEMDDSDPNYSYGYDGLYEFKIKDMKHAKAAWKEMKDELGIKSFQEYIGIHNKLPHRPDSEYEKFTNSIAKRIGAVIIKHKANSLS